MNLSLVADRLQQAGWKNVAPGKHLELDFDLVGSRWFTLTQWTVLVKSVPVLDAKTTLTWQEYFNTLNKKSKSWIWGKCFLLCLVTKEVAPETADAIQSDNFGLLGVIRLQGGGGRVLIANEAQKMVYGKVPSLPYDAHKFTSSVKEVLTDSFSR